VTAARAPESPPRVALETLTVVVPNWETPDLTLRCVRALEGDGVPADRIVVVENGSRDDSVERLGSELDGPRLLHLPENVGYARAANRGAELLDGDAYLIINNDAFAHRPGSVARMLAALDDPRVGVVVPRLLNEDLTLQPTVRPRDTPSAAFVRALGVSRFVPNRWQPSFSTYWDHSHSRFIECADGPVMLVRGELWRRLGGLVEASVFHSEDTDLYWRAHRNGFRVWFERDAEFVHLGNASASRHWSHVKQGDQIGRGEGRVLRQHMSLPRGAASLLFTVLGLAGRAAYFGARGNRRRAAVQMAWLRGYVRGFRGGGRTARANERGPSQTSD
jgi:GT2 family glycosyltransferase